MISHSFYNIVHVVGIILAMLALGGAAMLAMSTPAGAMPKPARRLLAIMHGIGAFLILLGGFGMLARLGIHGGFPAWLWVKLGIWAIVAAGLFLPRRNPSLAKPLLLALPILGGVAAYMAIYKPI
jgi:hypothetical protein